MFFRILHSKITISIALFLLAFIPRLLDLDRFLTADEFLWVDRSRNFLAGLTNSAYQCTSVVDAWGNVAEGLACTLRTGHPGVTTMWTGSFGLVLSWLADPRRLPLHEYIVGVSTNPLNPSLIAPTRFGTVLITSIAVVAAYWLFRRLFGAHIALVAAVIIALDPFHIALSRVIHHDALSTTFMTLSVLTALIYWGQNEHRKWLISSGILAGFAFLSKSPSLYLIPFVGLVALWFMVKAVRHSEQVAEIAGKIPEKPGPNPYLIALKRTVLDGLIWVVTAVAVVFIFWPAMWVVPLETLKTVFLIGSKYATGGHAKGNFFMGTISNDPGPLFYPVSWLFRASPIVLVGIISLPVVWLLSWRTNKRDQTIGNKDSSFSLQPSSFTRYLPLILIFILGYYLLMTVGEKKQERYFLPVYPWLNLLAAAGLVGIVTYLWSLFTSNRSEPKELETTSSTSPKSQQMRYAAGITGILLVAVLVINGFLLTQHFPYYFTYYNPLLGGPKRAAEVLTIGWGEGLDIVADYFNHQVNPTKTRVSSWYQSTFAPFYYGPAISYSKEKGKALAGNYVVFYINQVQRRFPDDIMFDFFTRRFTPQQVINLQGIDYAWIYPSLGIDHYVEDQTYTGIASLLAWQWTGANEILSPAGSSGFELYWEYLGKNLDEPFFFRLVDTQGRTWAENESTLLDSFNPPVENWREGEILFESGLLFIPPGTPPGVYELQVGFYTNAPAVTEGELLFELPPDEAMVTVGHTDLPNFTFSPEFSPVAEPLGDSLTLLGAAWPRAPLAPGVSVPLELYWRVEQSLPADSEVHLGLMDESAEAKQAWFNLSLAETFNPSETTWQAGDIILTRWQLELLPDIPAGDYSFELVLPADTEVTVPFGPLVVEE